MLELSIGFGFGIVSLLTALLIGNYLKYPQAWAFLGLLIAVLGFLISPIVSPEHRWIAKTLQGTIPAMFWLNCRIIFADRMNWNQGVWVIAVYGVVASTVGRHMVLDTEWIKFFFWELPILIEYILLVMAFGTIIANWSQDLVETRRLFRGWVLVIAGCTIVAGILTIRLQLGNQLVIVWIADIGILLVAALLLSTRAETLISLSPLAKKELSEKKLSDLITIDSVNSISTASNSEDFQAVSDDADSTGTDQDDGTPNHDRWMLNRLNELMASGYYRNDGLTIAKLAQDVDIPEYKTRQVINQYLGYRNFNDYIHQLRIADAAEKLLEDPQLPILNISLDVGYRTLSSFNRAFKDIKGVSPSEYRRIQRNDT